MDADPKPDDGLFQFKIVDGTFQEIQYLSKGRIYYDSQPSLRIY